MLAPSHGHVAIDSWCDKEALRTSCVPEKPHQAGSVLELICSQAFQCFLSRKPLCTAEHHCHTLIWDPDQPFVHLKDVLPPNQVWEQSLLLLIIVTVQDGLGAWLVSILVSWDAEKPAGISAISSLQLPSLTVFPPSSHFQLFSYQTVISICLPY